MTDYEKISPDAFAEAFGKEVPLTLNGKLVGTAEVVALKAEGVTVELKLNGQPVKLTGVAPMAFGFTVAEESRRPSGDDDCYWAWRAEQE